MSPDDICDSADAPTGTECRMNGRETTDFLTNPKNLCPATTEPTPRAVDAAAGENSPKAVRQSRRPRSTSLPGARPRPTERGHPASIPSSPVQKPTGVIRPTFLNMIRSRPRCPPLPDPFCETQPLSPTSRYFYLHCAMEYAMVETRAMLLGWVPIASGWYINSIEKYLAATDVLPYCPQAACGFPHRYAMVYFSSYRELKHHTQCLHPDIKKPYRPCKREYHVLLRLLLGY